MKMKLIKPTKEEIIETVKAFTSTVCIDARLPSGIHRPSYFVVTHGHSDHIPLVGSVVAPEIHRKSDTFKHIPHKEFINFGQRVIALKGRVDELIASYVGETFFLSPEEISGATNKEVDKLHSTWVEIVIKTKYGRMGFVITGLAVGDLNYKEVEIIKRYIQARDPDFVMLPSYGVFGEEGIKNHDVPEDVENPEIAMQKIVRELAKDLLIEGKMLVGLEHGGRADWAELSLSVAFRRVCDLSEYKEEKRSSP